MTCFRNLFFLLCFFFNLENLNFIPRRYLGNLDAFFTLTTLVILFVRPFANNLGFSIFQEYTIPARSLPKSSESSSYYYEKEERELPAITTGTRTYNYETTGTSPGNYPLYYFFYNEWLQDEEFLRINSFCLFPHSFEKHLSVY